MYLHLLTVLTAKTTLTYVRPLQPAYQGAFNLNQTSTFFTSSINVAGSAQVQWKFSENGLIYVAIIKKLRNFPTL